MNELIEVLKEMALTPGASKADIAATEILTGSLPSVDLTYVLPEVI